MFSTYLIQLMCVLILNFACFVIKKLIKILSSHKKSLRSSYNVLFQNLLQNLSGWPVDRYSDNTNGN